MNDVLEKRLFEKYPIFRKPIDFEVNDGWFRLIDSLAGEIMKIYSDNHMPINIVVMQVKQKYGQLRFYYCFDYFIEDYDYDRFDELNISDLIFEAVRKAEEKSLYMCEFCGKHGKLRNESSWIVTLCDECNKKYNTPASEIEKDDLVKDYNLYKMLENVLLFDYVDIHAIYKPGSMNLEFFNKCYMAAVDLERQGKTFMIFFKLIDERIHIFKIKRWYFG